MNLKENLSESQIKLCENAGIILDSDNQSLEELLEIERKLVEYIEQNCINEDFIEIEEEYDQIVDIVMDLESESSDDNEISTEIVENDHVKLTNGKCGVVIDCTNNAYTIEIDEEYKTGKLDEDIMIVALSNIVGRI